MENSTSEAGEKGLYRGDTGLKQSAPSSSNNLISGRTRSRKCGQENDRLVDTQNLLTLPPHHGLINFCQHVLEQSPTPAHTNVQDPQGFQQLGPTHQSLWPPLLPMFDDVLGQETEAGVQCLGNRVSCSRITTCTMGRVCISGVPCQEAARHKAWVHNTFSARIRFLLCAISHREHILYNALSGSPTCTRLGYR